MMAKCTIVSFAVMDCSQHSVASVAIKSVSLLLLLCRVMSPNLPSSHTVILKIIHYSHLCVYGL